MGETTTTATTKATKIYKQIIKRSILDIFIGYDKINGKKTNFVSSRKQPLVPLDKGLQWGNVKQKPFRQM